MLQGIAVLREALAPIEWRVDIDESDFSHQVLAEVRERTQTLKCIKSVPSYQRTLRLSPISSAWDSKNAAQGLDLGNARIFRSYPFVAIFTHGVQPKMLIGPAQLKPIHFVHDLSIGTSRHGLVTPLGRESNPERSLQEGCDTLLKAEDSTSLCSHPEKRRWALPKPDLPGQSRDPGLNYTSVILCGANGSIKAAAGPR